MDTRSKRASSVAFLLGFCILAPVAPDGTLAAGDRQHIALSYSGILAGAPAVIFTPNIAVGVSIRQTLTASVSLVRALTATVEI